MNQISLGIIIGISDKRSKEWVSTCAESCEKYNLDYEILQGIEKKDYKTALETAGSFPVKGFKIKNTWGCVLSSHILAWKRVIEVNKTTLIMEHDAIIKSPDIHKVDVPDLSIVHMGKKTIKNEFLDKEKRRYEKQPYPYKGLYKKFCSRGAHAYSITPGSAKYLYEKITSEGANMGIDDWIAQRHRSTNCGLPLYQPDPPSLVIGWVRGSTC